MLKFDVAKRIYRERLALSGCVRIKVAGLAFESLAELCGSQEKAFMMLLSAFHVIARQAKDKKARKIIRAAMRAADKIYNRK